MSIYSTKASLAKEVAWTDKSNKVTQQAKETFKLTGGKPASYLQACRAVGLNSEVPWTIPWKVFLKSLTCISTWQQD